MVFAFGNYELDTHLFELRRGGVRCLVEPQVFDVLLYLIEHRDRIVKKDELLDTIWGDRFVTEGTLSSRVMAARKAVGDSGRTQEVIQTLHGRGFRFIAPVEERDHVPRDEAAIGRSTAPAGAGDPAILSGLHGISSGTVTGRVESTTLLGRAGELAQLRGCLDQVLVGERQVVFVTGEAGVGKSTLIESFLREASTLQPLWILHGQCLDFHDLSEPYRPVLEALGRISRGASGVEIVSTLEQCAPTWLVQMPWLLPSAQEERLLRLTAGSTRERMLREIVEAIEMLADIRPMILLLEDLHWSDPSTLDLVSALAHRADNARVMVIGTYRPSEGRSDRLPVDDVQHELRIRGRCVRLALPMLEEEAVGQLISKSFPGLLDEDAIAEIVFQRSEGNPLFIKSLLDYWTGLGYLVHVDGHWAMQADLSSLSSGMPDSLNGMIAHQFGQIEAEDRELLEVASVIGVEFPADVVAAVLDRPLDLIELRLSALARRGLFLRETEAARRRDGTTSGLFRFLHVLFQEVIYERVPTGVRLRLHGKIAELLVTAYGPEARQHSVALATHFIRAHDYEHGASYLMIAAEQALRRSAPREVVNLTRTALQVLDSIPEDRRDRRSEISLRQMLGAARTALYGWADEEAEEAFVHACSIGREINEPSFLASTLYGLATLNEFRGNYRTAEAILQERETIAGLIDSTDRLLETREVQACSAFHQGKFTESVSYAEEGLKAYDPKEHIWLFAAHGNEPAIALNAWSSFSLWFLGFPDQAIRRVQELLRLAQDPQRIFSKAYALMQAASLYQHLRQPEQVREFSEALLREAETPGFSYCLAVGSIMLGWSHAARGAGDQGITLIEEGLERHLRTGAAMDRPYYLGLLASACCEANRPEKGVEALKEAFGMIRKERHFFYEAELYRIQAVLLNRLRPDQMDRSEAGLRRALEIARSQGARSIELRVLSTLVQTSSDSANDGTLWRDELESVYRSFTEGFDSPDLMTARAILEGQGSGMQTELSEF